MKHKRFFLRYISTLSLLFMIVACSQTSVAPSGTTPSASISPTALPPSPTMLSTTVPTATPPPLGAVPQNCSPGPAPRSIFGGLGPVIGAAPVWVAGFAGPHAVLLISSYDTHAQHGWYWKLIWEVGPRFLSHITIRGINLHTGAPLWFQFTELDPIGTSLLLDPHHPDHPGAAAGSDYAEWGSIIYIPTAACYQLEVTWSGGQWSLPFAAGRQ